MVTSFVASDYNWIIWRVPFFTDPNQGLHYFVFRISRDRVQTVDCFIIKGKTTTLCRLSILFFTSINEWSFEVALFLNQGHSDTESGWRKWDPNFTVHWSHKEHKFGRENLPMLIFIHYCVSTYNHKPKSNVDLQKRLIFRGSCKKDNHPYVYKYPYSNTNLLIVIYVYTKILSTR